MSVPVANKVLELVASIYLKSADCIKLPVRTKISVVFGVFLVIFLLTCDILVTSLPYLSVDRLMFFCSLLCGSLRVVVVVS